jgi:hypothetical protein
MDFLGDVLKMIHSEHEETLNEKPRTPKSAAESMRLMPLEAVVPIVNSGEILR